jgi:WD40 repeat protein
VVLRGHTGPVNAALCDESGDRILSASADGTLRLWVANQADLLALADSRITRDFSTAERQRYADLLDPKTRD